MNFDSIPDISFINFETVTDVSEQMLSDYQNKYKAITGKEVELTEANPYRIILNACAMQIYQAEQRIDLAGKMNFLKYAYGDYLDNLGLLKGVSRLQSEAAITTIRFSITSAIASAVSIPQGTLVSNNNGVYFATDDYAEITAGNTYVDVSATCTESGSAGANIAAGDINTLVDTVAYITSVSNVSKTIGGRDLETDDELRQRIYEAGNAYTTTGTEGAYIYHVKEVSSDIEDVIVTSTTPGTVNVYFTLEGGEVPDSAIIALVQDHLDNDDVRPLTDTVVVSAPTTQPYDIDVTYYIAASDSSQVTSIQSNIATAIEEYKAWQSGAIGRDINPSYLIYKMVEAGAKRVDVTSPARVVLAANVIAVLDTETVTYGGLEDD